MLQLHIKKTCCEGIPVRIVHPIRDEGKALILYHGWSSRGEYQTTKAAVFALHGYTVLSRMRSIMGSAMLSLITIGSKITAFSGKRSGRMSESTRLSMTS